jgi:hypothetical protein
MMNCEWAAFCNGETDWEELADIDCLEPDPKHRREEMRNVL